MRERRFKRFSIRGPVVLFALVLVLAVTLTVLWNVALVHDYNRLRDLAAGGGAFHGALIAVGSALLLAIIVLSCVLGIQLITNLRWSQRQSNFLASVSHELNSPLTSIKLYAQTLRRDDLSAPDRAGFVRKILFDTDRLSHDQPDDPAPLRTQRDPQAQLTRALGDGEAHRPEDARGRECEREQGEHGQD